MGGINIFEYVIFVMIFSYLIFNDLKFKTVDDRHSIVLFLWVVLCKLIAGISLSHFLQDLFISILISYFVFINSFRIIKLEKSDCLIESEEGLPFLPSLGISMLLFYFYLPVSQIRTVNDFFLLGINNLYNFQIAKIIILCLFLYMIYRSYMFLKSKKEEIELRFGDGDLIICVIIGVFLGYKDFLIVFYLSMLVHVLIGLILKIFNIFKVDFYKNIKS